MTSRQLGLGQNVTQHRQIVPAQVYMYTGCRIYIANVSLLSTDLHRQRTTSLVSLIFNSTQLYSSNSLPSLRKYIRKAGISILPLRSRRLLSRVFWGEKKSKFLTVKILTLMRVSRRQSSERTVVPLCFNHLRWQLIADRNEWPKPCTTNSSLSSSILGRYDIAG